MKHLLILLAVVGLLSCTKTTLEPEQCYQVTRTEYEPLYMNYDSLVKPVVRSIDIDTVCGELPYYDDVDSIAGTPPDRYLYRVEYEIIEL